MNPSEFFAKRKIHLMFAGAFTVVLGANIILGFTAGQTFLGASWSALADIRPMEYVMLVLFWHACAVPGPKDEWQTSLITLNLSRSDKHE